ncbi:sporulation protein YunB [Alicyclobacillus sp. SO9]|uniref:sporulation protein YunB n=1 Tax=Alicyclobacillus sp. SO9 TaxID=2665646 RepID=UPI0018E788C5|nr:sporulation protein YunB [Alicyclobacillus sp. SO9]QQE77470.1 hypothetical protein GI364_16160 [Alicyclobacillus sp. SO9]
MVQRGFQARPGRKRNRSDTAVAPRKRGMWRWIGIFLMTLALAAAWMWIMEVRLSPVVKEAADGTARDVGTMVLSESVEQQLPTMPDARELIDSGRAQGNVRVSQLDFTELMDFQHRVEDNANARLKNLARQTVKVPLAQLLGASWLSPFTAEVPVRLSLSGRVHSTLDVVTRPVPPDAATHVVYLKLTARVQVQQPFQGKPVTIHLTAPVTYFTMSSSH